MIRSTAAAVIVVAVAAVAGLAAHGTIMPAAASCVTRTAWMGAEENSLTQADRTVTWGAPQTVTVTAVTLSASLAPSGPGFNEALFLVGYSGPGQTAWTGTGSDDPMFGPPSGYGPDFHGNRPQDSTLDAVILKSTEGQAVNEAATVTTGTVIAGGGQLFLNMGDDGPVTSDFEAQVEITYEACQ